MHSKLHTQIMSVDLITAHQHDQFCSKWSHSKLNLNSKLVINTLRYSPSPQLFSSPQYRPFCELPYRRIKDAVEPSFKFRGFMCLDTGTHFK